MIIYVENLSLETTEADLREVFEAFGRVHATKIIKNRISSESKGFGFIEMPAKAEAKDAIAGLNGRDLKGQALRIN